MTSTVLKFTARCLWALVTPFCQWIYRGFLVTGEVYFLMMIPWCFSYYCLRCLGFSPCCSPFRCGIFFGKFWHPKQTFRFGGNPFSFGFSEPNKNSGKKPGRFLKMTGRIRRFFEMVVWNGEFEGHPKTNIHVPKIVSFGIHVVFIVFFEKVAYSISHTCRFFVAYSRSLAPCSFFF